MKNVILTTAVLLFGFAANAKAPLSFQPGRYSFAGRMTVMTVLESQQVYMGAQGGPEQRAEYEKQGFECRFKDDNWYVCNKLHDDMVLPNEVAQELLQKFKGKLNLEFAEERAPSKVLRTAGDTEEWRFTQKVTWNNSHTLEQFNVLRLGSTDKLTLGADEFLVRGGQGATQTYAVMEYPLRVIGNTLGTYTYFTYLELDPE
jgi:hypothetical protein